VAKNNKRIGMKNALTLLVSGSLLAACGGGHSGPTGVPGAPGKSAYEIWLEHGNTGTEQDFLNWIVSGGNSNTDDDGNKNFNTWGDIIENQIAQGQPYYNYRKTTVALPNQQEYDLYKYSEDDVELDGKKYTANYTYREKIFNLIKFTWGDVEYENEDGVLGTGYNSLVEFKDGVSEIYPASGTIFQGVTFAHIRSDDDFDTIAGGMTFKYIPGHHEITFDFDNYYTLSYKEGNGIEHDLNIAGTNSTGNPAFDLPTGDYKNVYMGLTSGGHPSQPDIRYIGKDGYEEVWGKYITRFNEYESNITIDGVFGGTKQ